MVVDDPGHADRQNCYYHDKNGSYPVAFISERLEMATDSDVLLAYWQEQRNQARHSEDQRATLTNLILIISAATLGFLSQWGWTLRSLSITVPLVFLGLYGAIASAKL